MDDLRLTYYGHVFDASGYGRAARAYVHALHRAGVTLSVIDLPRRPERQVRDPLVESLLERSITPDFHLFHGIPPQWASRAFPLRNTIGMTVWETDAMPMQWRPALNHVIDVWLPCEFNVAVFGRELRSPVFRLPHPVTDVAPPIADESAPTLGADRDEFVFYSIFEWQDRKCPDELLATFLSTFHGSDGAHLIIKTNPGAAAAAAQAVAAIRRRTGSHARVTVHAEAWGDDRVEALHRRGDCYVSLHRGEGWGYPLFDAASRGTPAIATAYSGPLDYLTPSHCHLVPYRLAPVQQRYLYYHPRMRWAEPDLNRAAERMRWVFEHRESARDCAARSAARIREEFSLDRVGQLARDRLLELLRRHDAGRFRKLSRARDARRFQPPIPVPPEWYDADYFERGVKSNWEGGYHWADFAGLFRDTAAFLTEMFPDAHTFLDVGCARGFLVRALRERGHDALGIDHSPWAIAHADDEARPHVMQAGVDAYRPAGEFDMLLLFDLLPHLTEAQAEAFLQRARAWTRTALVAVIASFDDDAQEAVWLAGHDDNDLSHVLMRTRTWWDALFRRAGWRQDPLHRVAAAACERHPLPKRMGWKLYVYAP